MLKHLFSFLSFQINEAYRDNFLVSSLLNKLFFVLNIFFEISEALSGQEKRSSDF
jgi:hypothetical protein